MKPIGAYLRERFPLAFFGPICALLAGAAAASVTSTTIQELGLAFVLGVALVVQFRLWDDIEDRARDRIVHPTRVLVTAHAEPFQVVLVILTVAALALSASNLTALAITGAVNTAFWCAYRFARPRLSPNAWCFGLLLWKYPAFVAVMAFLLGDVEPTRLATAAATTYVCASGYELLHDRPAHVGGAS